ncbi:MAG: ATP-dependent DNA helicase RecG [Nitrospiraceae bacterium]|nr:ATP-dependent DNA helicase RecG [Nitrospiraceae bacterium]
MPRPDVPTPSDVLPAFVERVTRPIEFASRDAGAHLGAVRNLDRFISEQVIELLGGRVYPRSVEARLLSLRNLFVDFHTGLSPMEQRDRLAKALDLLRELSGATGAERAPSEPTDSGEREATVSPSQWKAGRPLWDLPIRFAKGVGPKRTQLLERLGISTVEEALWTAPWRYEDRSVVTPMAKLVPGMAVTVCGSITKASASKARFRRMALLTVWLSDGSGTVQTTFFNQPYLENVLKEGLRVMMTGRVIAGRSGWTELRLEVAQFEILTGSEDELLHLGRIVPVYHETKGWTSRQMRGLIHGLLAEYGAEVEEILPVQIRARYRLMPASEAIRLLHFPAPKTDLPRLDRGMSPSHRRLAFEELFVLQTAMALRHRATKDEPKPFRFRADVPLLTSLEKALPFRLTPAQERVFGEIQADMVSTQPMNRLVQGDVGSGKTVVALKAIAMACGSGYQSALMVPTEILAEQHFRNLSSLLGTIGLSAVLVTGGGKAKERNEKVRQLASGEAHVAIGTHALIQKRVKFANLGLAVIDEQHKFGVLQRKSLLEKGYAPDVLVMTATPIPRTLAMTVYGDLDVSVIDMLPPGRKPVRTFLFAESQRHKAWQLVRDQIQLGRQAYIVYPLVEESEKIDLKAAMQGAEQIQAEHPQWRVGLLHGRLSAAEKERTMRAFQAGDIQILVATTVIEVGVDVANATVMLIEHAERFGLAQLHQLRGRVGRGVHQSLCLLMASSPLRAAGPRVTADGTPRAESTAQQRLEALVKSTDGFVIAEDDLRIRGPGELLGLRQWGVPEFKVANLVRDADLLEQARREAIALVACDGTLSQPGHQALKRNLVRRWQDRLALSVVG